MRYCKKKKKQLTFTVEAVLAHERRERLITRRAHEVLRSHTPETRNLSARRDVRSVDIQRAVHWELLIIRFPVDAHGNTYEMKFWSVHCLLSPSPLLANSPSYSARSSSTSGSVM